MDVNYIPYGHQWIDENDVKAVTSVLKNDWISQGPKVAEFEKLIASYCHVKYSVAFSSGTAALHAASFAAGISYGDEVITTPITFAADGNCILYNGGKVKFVDIKADTYNIDPQKIREKISSKTKAIISVDFAGQPCDIDEIKRICEKNNIVFIEDAAHSIGAEYKTRRIGGLADLTIFSFHPVKTITTGEGGMVLTNNVEYYKKLKTFRTHGITKDTKELKKNDGDWYYEMQFLGYNYRITDIQCALGISQFSKLENFVARRREIAMRYNDLFKNMKEITIPYEKPDVKSAYHLYVIKLNLDRIRVNRKKVFDVLREKKIGVHVHYIPVHLHPYYQENFRYKKGDFPISEDYYNRALTLPIFPKMSEQDINYVASNVKKIIEKYRK
jgi:UDP-4-amino-4,6-dideoxy-N-acetyl-beta-L-altrosamine transaminase